MEKKGRAKEFHIPSAAPSYDVFLPDYYSEKFVQIHNRFNDQKFTVSDTGITSRVINHWEKCDLFPEGTKKGGEWRKFSLVEIAWLKIVKHLRDFGVSLEKIAKAKKMIMDWHEKERAYFMFEYYLAMTLFENSDTCLVFLSDGTASVSSLRELEMFRPVQEPMDMLIIPLRSILSETGWVAVNDIDPASFISKEIIALRNSLFCENNEQILVRMKNGKVAEIESTSSQKENPKIDQVNKDFKDAKNYGEYTVAVEGGVAQSVKVVKRKRL